MKEILPVAAPRHPKGSGQSQSHWLRFSHKASCLLATGGSRSNAREIFKIRTLKTHCSEGSMNLGFNSLDIYPMSAYNPKPHVLRRLPEQ